MNRRSFITSMLAAAVAPMALKGAGRTWKRTEDLWIPNPDYENATHGVLWCSQFFVHPFPSNRNLVTPIIYLRETH